MVDERENEGPARAATPPPDGPRPSTSPPADTPWARPGQDAVEPDSVTTELPRGVFASAPGPVREPGRAGGNAQAGALPARSPFAVAGGSTAQPAPSPWAPTTPPVAQPAVGPSVAGRPDTPPVPFARPADAPGAWWNPDASAIPSRPPEYDPTRFGALGAAGGVPPLPGGPATRSSAPDARPRRALVGTALLVGVLSAIIASLITGGLFVAFTDAGGERAAAPTTIDRGPAPTLVAPLDIYELLERAQPSVVSIRTDISSGSGTITPFGAGSGVIISEDGLVLTNAHVIAGSSTMRVTLHDGQEQDATLVGSFPADDIALIRIGEPVGLIPAVLGNSADIVVGDPVVAIGNALNLGGPPSVTEGIVSAKDRNIQTREGTLRNLIQTDAAINPGNSGGPLLNAQGQVVGINTAIIDDAQNIGFAISIDLLKPLIDDLREGRGDITPDTPFLGVTTQTLGDVTDAVLERYGVTAADGAFVSDVVPGSGAAEAGLQPGDVIVGIDGQEVTSSTDVGSIIRNREAGEMITLEIERQGDPRTLTATLKSRAETGN